MRKEDFSNDAEIAKYQSETYQVSSMRWVLVCTIVAGTLLMMLSIISPFILLYYPPAGTLNVAQQLSTAPRDVLPFATALVGFAGGVVVAMYRTGPAQRVPPTTSSSSSSSSSPGGGKQTSGGAPSVP